VEASAKWYAPKNQRGIIFRINAFITQNPTILLKEMVGWPQNLPKGANVAKRLIWINDEIDSDLIEEMERKLEKLNRKSAAPIQVLINSGGGDSVAAFAIYDLFRNSRAPVHATVVGDASSGASLILLGGDKRRMLANARIFIHNPWTQPDESRLDRHGARRVFENIEDVRKRWLAVLQKHLEAKRGKIIRWMDREKYFYADEALQLGFVHEIVKSQKGKPFPKKKKKGKKKR
jgi:ATP-dependent Clp protease protease subunit